jgi:uncharacterized membrane protein
VSFFETINTIVGILTFNMSFRKSFLKLLVLFCSVLISPAIASASESITSFHSDITINRDTSVTIEEKINYTTTLNKHGIYRYIPETFTRNGIKNSRSITDITVTDDQSNPLQFEKISDGPFLTLKIGDPNNTFTGDQTYLITYTMSQAIDRYEEDTTYHELYWDITGEGWKIPIASATAIVNSPHAKIIEVDCFSGTIGDDDGKCITAVSPQSDRADFFYPHTVSYGENMTVAVMLEPENELVFAAASTTLLQTIFHNLPLAAVPLPLLLTFGLWYYRGRDYAFTTSNVYNLDPNQSQRRIWPSLRAREPFVYAPIKELTPGQAGLLLNEKVDTRDLVAEILELARKKFLKIKVVTSSTFLGLGTKTDYRFIKLKTEDSELPTVQKYLFEQIFKSKDTILVSELKGTFYKHMATAGTKLEQSVGTFFNSKPSTARGLGIFIFVATWSAVIFWLSITFFSLDIFWPLPFLLIQLPLGILLGYNLPQKTAIGHALWLQTRGLRKSINYGKWREKIKEKNLFIEEVLPFAVSLGVVDQLSKDMEKLNIKPPDYLGTNSTSANSAMTLLNTQAFVSSFTSSVSSNLSYNPSSSSSGGGSGFSGGSSGGGGGGGGGGSW